ncbi:MAG TPA: FecR domain-containing protein [Polyangiaceae bacterium]
MDPSLTQLVRDVASAEREALGAFDLEPPRHRFLNYARRRKLLYRASGWLALGGLAASLLVAWLVLRPLETLEFEANGVQGTVGALLVAPVSSSLVLDFTDGSRLDLTHRTRARVLKLGQDTAHLKLESGSLLASVVHADRTRWQVDAGPFRVHVVGTRFELRWDPTTETVRIELYDGSLEVSGPKLRPGCVLLPGNELQITLNGDSSQGSCVIKDRSQKREPRLGKRNEKPTEEALAPPTPAAMVGRSRVALARWQEMAAQGSYARAWLAIQAQGFDSVSERANATDLMSLADVARFVGQPGRAAQALLALRERFSASPEAREAAFLLGRVAADQQGQPQRGSQWFSTYLAESPQGSFAPEALGRLLDCQVHAGDALQARQTAEKYLTRYPKGSYRGIAEHQLRQRAPHSQDSASDATRVDTKESSKTR